MQSKNDDVKDIVHLQFLVSNMCTAIPGLLTLEVVLDAERIQ